MRILCAMLKHETNTFSPVPTDLARFEAWGLQFGAAVRTAYENTAMPLAAYFKRANALGADIVTPVAAEAMPAGPVTRDAYETLTHSILEEVDKGCDVALLDLHGAMVTETIFDGEGTLLAQIRALAPDLPIAVTCDLHCNLTEAMIEHSTALIGYKTYPHTDMYQVADQVAQIVLGAAAGTCDPIMRWGQVPLLSQTLRQGTDDTPMAELIAKCCALEEQEGILAATVFGGFALADIPDAGSSAVVIAERAASDAAENARDALLAGFWASREEFVYPGTDLSRNLARASDLNDGPIMLLDHADNCGSGGTQDVMMVIEAVLNYRLDDVIMAAVWDPSAVDIMHQAGEGAELHLPLGGKTQMPAIGLPGKPLQVTGVVEKLVDGTFRVEGPMYTGVEVNVGKAALFRVGGMQIVVTSQHHEPWDTGIFTMMGLNPADHRYILLKSRIHYRAGFAPLIKHTVPLDGSGVTTSDNAMLNYRNVRRPIFPLDQETTFQ